MQGLLQALLAPRAGKDSVSIWRHTVCLRQLNKQHFNSEEKGVKQCLFSPDNHSIITMFCNLSRNPQKIQSIAQSGLQQSAASTLSLHLLA
jgi:hypothetical protein